MFGRPVLTASILLGIASTGAASGPGAAYGGAARSASPTLFADDNYRRTSLAQVLDAYHPVDSDESGWAGLTSRDVGNLFREIGAGAPDIASTSVIPNPEPSSLAVWAALACGLIAVAHGLRQRRTTVQPA
jgi:F0F1-type ATP synthase membrane subunit c/vacuolar-type H+-ATPase subunit K